MQSLKQLGNGFLLGVISVVLVLGAFALTMAEGGMMPSVLPSPTNTKAYPSVFPTLPLLDMTEEATIQIAFTSTKISTTATSCPSPVGWISIVIQPLDTVDSIALTYSVTQDQIKAANCITGNELTAGNLIFVPAKATSTPLPCGAPTGWINYIVKPGDTLYQIGILYRIGVSQLQQANCMGSNTTILAGQIIKVPNVPTSTATFTPIIPPTITSTPSSTETASETPEPSLTTEPASLTPEPTATDTPLAPTDTVSPEAPSETPTP